MKTLIQALLLSTISTSAFASTDVIPKDTNLLMWGFLGFAVSIILIQAIPATVMFYSMLKGLFASSDIKAMERN